MCVSFRAVFRDSIRVAVLASIKTDDFVSFSVCVCVYVCIY